MVNATDLSYLLAIRSEPDRADRRIKRLQLTKKGTALESELSSEQRRRFEKVFENAGPAAESGWRKVMALLAEAGD